MPDDIVSSNRARRGRHRRLCAVLVTALLAPLALVLGVAAPASATAPPNITPPACYKVVFGYQVYCEKMRANGTWPVDDASSGATLTIQGTVSPGTSFTTILDPGVPPCATTNSTGCYRDPLSVMPTVKYSVQYGEYAKGQAIARAVDYNLTAEQPKYDQVDHNKMHLCRADWNNVYVDGGGFAERAPAALRCTYDYKTYKLVNGVEQPLKFTELRGPTWLKVSSSVRVCDGPGCTPSHTVIIQGYVPVTGHMAKAPTPGCSLLSSSTSDGTEELTFSGTDIAKSELDFVPKWAFTPAGLTTKTSGTIATVTSKTPAKVTATFGITSWYGPMSAKCSGTIVGQPAPPAVTKHPASKKLKKGSTFTATAAATGSPAPNVKWQRKSGNKWVDVPKATKTKLSVKVSKTTKFRAVFSNSLGTAYTKTATATVLKKLKAKKPKITGTAQAGKTLKAKPGAWTSGTKFSYQWLRNGTKIANATKSSYQVKAKDRGKKISVKVTGKKSGYATASKTSASKKVSNAKKR